MERHWRRRHWCGAQGVHAPHTPAMRIMAGKRARTRAQSHSVPHLRRVWGALGVRQAAASQGAANLHEAEQQQDACVCRSGRDGLGSFVAIVVAATAMHALTCTHAPCRPRAAARGGPAPQSSCQTSPVRQRREGRCVCRGGGAQVEQAPARTRARAPRSAHADRTRLRKALFLRLHLLGIHTGQQAFQAVGRRGQAAQGVLVRCAAAGSRQGALDVGRCGHRAPPHSHTCS
jgi:hypothetical protein